jgi:hypothetical protein
MIIWQADFYKYLQQENHQSTLWQLIICDKQGQIIHEATCQQSEATYDWLVSQLKPIVQQYHPDIIQVFRPQCFGLFSLAGGALEIKIEATRRTPQLKQILIKRNPNTLKLHQDPPQALAEKLWGEKWHFASFKAGEIIDYFSDRPIPIMNFPESLNPITLGLSSDVNVPGVIIYGGRKSLYLARWLEENKPVFLNYIPTTVGESGGLILESGLIDRWILLTFEDSEMAKSAQQYEQQKESSKGLHFLLIQPDDSGMTYTGIWLLKKEEI